MKLKKRIKIKIANKEYKLSDFNNQKNEIIKELKMLNTMILKS